MFELRWEPGSARPSDLERIDLERIGLERIGLERIGLEGLRARRGRCARWAAVPGSAVSGGRGIRWPRREQRDTNWWPQGIDVQGGFLIVSWHHPEGGTDTSARVTVVDGTRRRPRFWHVLLVDGDLQPITIHAGGLAWHGDRLYVADTFGGLRHFDTRDIAVRDGEYVLPQSGGYRSAHGQGERAMRYSFASLEHGEGVPKLIAGEYRAGTDDARLLRVELGGAEPEVHGGPERMQGACVVDGIWYVTTSNGPRRAGDLWVGAPGALVRRPGVLPPGPEDLAHEPGSRRLWSVSEHPGSRFIYAIAI